MFRIPAPCLVIDNANGKRISNDALESIITEGEGHVRTLGKSELVHVINRSLLVVTGRGLEFSGDMTRREFTLNPLASDASPETRAFKLDPPTYVAEHRGEMLTAAFTIMRAFRRAGMPKLAKTAVGSFPEWERRVRNLVMWLTKIDVTDQFARNREIASDKQTDAALLHALYVIFPNKPFLAGDVQRIYDEIEAQKRRGIYTFPSKEKDAEGKAEANIRLEKAAKEAGEEAILDLMGQPPLLRSEAEVRAEVEAKVRAAAEASDAAEARARAELQIYEALKEMCGDKPVTAGRIGGWARRVENAHIAGLVMTRTTNSRQQTDLCITKT
jgi:hypothetical protein